MITSSTRRDFLRMAGMGLLGTSLASCGGNGKKETDAEAPSRQQDVFIAGGPRIAMQLYTVRDQIAIDLKGTLHRLAEIGFTHVETAFWPAGITHQRAADHLREAGLTPISSHIEIPGSPEERRKFLEIAKAYGCTRMIWHGWPEDPRYQTVAGTQQLIRLYNDTSQFAQDNGLSFGLHNHWWEFRNRPDGRRVFEYWLENLDQEIFLELDTYWIKVAGDDPAAMIRQAGNRVKFLHIKDGPAKWHENLAEDNPDPMTAVGTGAQNIPSIVAAAQGHVEWLVIEMDKVEGDVFQILEKSLTNLKGFLNA